VPVLKTFREGVAEPLEKTRNTALGLGNSLLGCYPYLPRIPLHLPPIPLRFSLRFFLSQQGNGDGGLTRSMKV